MATSLLKISSLFYVIFGAITLIPVLGWAISGVAFIFLPAPHIFIDFVANSFDPWGSGSSGPEWLAFILWLGMSGTAIVLGLLGMRAADWLKNNERRGKIAWGFLVSTALVSSISNMVYNSNASGSLIANQGLISFIVALIFIVLYLIALLKVKPSNH